MMSRVAVAAVLVSSVLAVLPAAANDAIMLTMDQATVIKMPDRTKTIIVGNPAIADVSVHKGVMVLTGKSFGETNMLALDDTGALVSETRLRVRPASSGTVTVVRAGETETYSCSPLCAPTMALGDSEKHFARTGQQVGSRNAIATGGNAAPR
jgi:hypothetical protein